MIQITLHDSFSNELSLDDIILVNYPNPDIKFLGVLKSNEDTKQFILSYGPDAWHSIFLQPHEKYQRIGKSSEKPHLLNLLGRYDKKRKTAYLLKILTQKI